MTEPFADLSFADLLDALAAKTPSPGGGLAASAAGALSAALAQMVVAYSLGKKNLADHQDELERASRSLHTARLLMLELGEEDAQAYALVAELQKLPEADPRRQHQLPAAAQTSIQIPLAMIAAVIDLLRLYERLARITNQHLASDLAIAAVLAESAARSARWNVVVNAPLLPAADARRHALEQAETAIVDAQTRRNAVETACRTIA